MFKKISSLILVIVMLVSLLPNVYAADEMLNPYEGISLGDDLSGANNTTYRVEAGKIGYVGPNQHYWYDNVDFGKLGPMKAEVVIASKNSYATGTVVFRLDATDGPVIAEVSLAEAFAEITTYSRHTIELELLTEITGVHTVYMFTANATADYYSLNFVETPDPALLYTEYDERSNTFPDIADSKYCYDINLVSGLGFKLADEGAEKLYPDGYMTRGKFADLLLGLLDAENVAAERAFSDVDEEHPYYDSINKIAALGYIRGVGDGKFLPNNYITVQDAAACVINILGYSRIAESNGGYASGHMLVAKREELLTGLNDITHLTNGAAARFIKNVIRAEYYEIASVSANGEAVYNRIAEGILAKTKKIYRGVGLVEGNDFTLVNSPNTSITVGAVKINGELFSTGKTYGRSMLGYECEYFYQDVDGEKILLQILPYEKTEKTVIDSLNYNITKISTSAIVYENKATAKEEELQLDNCRIIYNNVNLDGALSDVISYPFKGRITYVENAASADTLFIENYRNIKVEAYDEVTGLLRDKISGETFDTSKWNFFLTLDGENVLTTNVFMKNVDLGMLYISRNRQGTLTARLIADTATVTGKVESIDSNGIATINGKEYTVDTTSVRSLGLDPVAAGLSATFAYNTYNEIVFYKVETNTGLQLGYLVKWGINNPGRFSEECYVKIIDRNDETNIYTFAESAKIDGKRYRKDDGMSDSVKASSENAPVKYMLDDSGNIKIFDSIYQGTNRGSDSDDMLILSSTTADNKLTWSPEWSAFMDKSDNYRMKMVSDDNTVMFCTDGDEEDWSFKSLTDYSSFDYNGKAYSSNANQNVIDVVVTTRKAASGNAVIVTFDEKSQVVNGDYEICTKITCHTYNTTYQYIIEDEAIQKQIEVLKKGDLLTVVNNGEIIEENIGIVMFADGSKSRAYDGGTLNAKVYYTADDKLGTTGNGCDGTGYAAGVVTDKFDEFVEIKMIIGDADPVYSYYKLNTSTQLTSKYSKTGNYVKMASPGSDIQVGDIVCVTMYQKSIKGVHVIVDATLAGLVD